MRRGAAIFAAALAVASCAPKHEPLTELVVVVDSNLVSPSQVDEIDLDVTGAKGEAVHARAYPTSSTALPLTVSVLPGRDPSDQITVTVVAKLAGAAVITQTSRLRFSPQSSMALSVTLDPSCLGVPCAQGSTCDGAGACAPIDVGPERLSVWSGSAPAHKERSGGSGARVVALALGEGHSCALVRTGAVLCWGTNDELELGSDVLGSAIAGRVVPGIADAIAVAAASDYACALRADATVWCWGSDADGQLGDGTSAKGHARAEPKRVSGLAHIAQIAAGEGHACAIDEAGSMWCWGDNDRRQLGDGTIIDRSTPTPVVGLEGPVASIAVGETHTCARLTTGRVQCWGANEYGQLGTGEPGDDVARPAFAVGVSDVVSLGAGSYHACAINKSRSVTCWGRNNHGQLGDGTNFDRATPTAVSGISDARDIAPGELSTCARTESGAVACWGDNEFGQLGDGTTQDRTSPVNVANLRADELRAGNYHVCARRNLAPVVCWGRNDSGQLGDGTTTNRRLPTSTVGLP